MKGASGWVAVSDPRAVFILVRGKSGDERRRKGRLGGAKGV